MSNELNNQDFLQKTSEEITKETNRILDEAESIFKLAKEKGENIDDIKKEYEDVRQTAIDSYKNDQEITKDELSLIKLELSQLKNISEEGVHNSTTDYILDKLSGPAISLGYTTDDLKEWSFFDIDTLNTKQDELVDEILGGENKGFGNGYVKGFNTEIGNYVTKISDFEAKLQSPSLELKNMNSREIANYIMYLNENGGISENILIEKLGLEKTKELINLWKNSTDTFAQNILKKAGLGNIIDEINDMGKFIKLPFNKLINTLSLLDNNLDTESISKLPLQDLENFTNNVKEFCPTDELDRNKLKTILSITQIELIKKRGEEKVKEETIKIIKSRIKGEIPEDLMIEIEEFSKTILDEGIENLEDKNKKPCAFDLREFTDKELKDFLNSDNISPFLDKKNQEITELEYQKLAAAITGTNLERAIHEAQEISENPENYSESQKVAVYANVEHAKQVHFMASTLTSEQVKEYSVLVEKFGRDEAIKQIVDSSPVLSKHFNGEESVSNSNFTTTEKSYIKTDLGYQVQLDNGETIQGLIISPEEKKLTVGNPEALKNLVNFYEFFKELNLESVWNYRKELMLSMGNMNINFIDNDSLSKSELVQFGNSLINTINNLTKDNKDLNTKPKLHTESSLSGVKNELRKFSGAGSILSNDKTSNLKGEDKFAATLRHFGIIGGAYFKINKLRENIK